MSLAAGTAAAQDPPSIQSITPTTQFGKTALLLDFDQPVTHGSSSLFTITVDGVDLVDLNNEDGISPPRPGVHQAGSSVLLTLRRVVDEDAVIVVSMASGGAESSTTTGLAARSFIWDVTNGRQLPTVYDALGAYFSGKATLFGERVTLRFVNSVLQEADGQSYRQRLQEEVDAGRLDEVVPGPQSAWGDPGTEDWVQMGHGYPREVCYEFQGQTRCKDMSETWGSQYSCGGQPQPGLHDNDYGDFFWACTGDGQWVPVRRHRPGVDYAHDHQLVRPVAGASADTDEGRCLYRDEDGNPTPTFTAHFDADGNVIRNPDGSVQGTTTHGANWDPIAQKCTTRG